MSARQGLVRGALTYLRRDLREIVAPTSLPDDDVATTTTTSTPAALLAALLLLPLVFEGGDSRGASAPWPLA